MKKLTISFLIIVLTSSINAQQFQNVNLLPKSPEIHSDNTVTLRVYAPEAVYESQKELNLLANRFPELILNTDKGGHTFIYWRICAHDFLPRLFKK